MSFYPDGVNRANLSRANGADHAITTPGSASIEDSPGLQGSMQQVLMENLGQYVQIDFLVGINTLVRRSGILYSVGRSYVVLYDETEQDFILCDVFAAKFISFFGRRPPSRNQDLGVLTVDSRGNPLPVTGSMPGSMMGGMTGGMMEGTDFFEAGTLTYPTSRTLGG